MIEDQAPEPTPNDPQSRILNLMDSGRFDEAKMLAGELLKKVEMIHGTDALRTAEVLDLYVGAVWRGGNPDDPRATELAERAVQIKEMILGPDDLEVALSLNNLGNLARILGNYEVARKSFERALAIREENLGPEDPEVAISLGNRALLFADAGDYGKARPLLERALAIEEKAFGLESLDVADTLNNFGILLRHLDDFGASRNALDRSLAIRKKLLGKDHIDVARSLHSLASLFDELAKYEESRVLLEQALEIRIKALGSEHPSVARTLENIGVIYYRLGNYLDASPYYEQSLLIKEKTLGRDHPEVAMVLNKLGVLSRELGDFDTAQSNYQRSLAILEKVFGAEHPDVALLLNNLANVFSQTGQFIRARSLYERALAIREDIFGPEHSEVAQTLINLALLLRNMGDLERARSLNERALAIWEKTYGPEHPHIAASLNNLGDVLQSLGEFEIAKQMHIRALEIWEKTTGPDHSNVAIGLHNLGYDALQSGDHDKALSFYQRALAKMEKSLGKNHPLVAFPLMGLGYLEFLNGKYSAAMPLYERAHAIREEGFGPEHPFVAMDLASLAVVLAKTGYTFKALGYTLEAEEIGREHFRLISRSLSERQALRYTPLRAAGLQLALSLAGEGLPPVATGEVWDALIRSRALLFDQIAARNRMIVETRDPEISRLGEELGSVRTQLANLVVQGPDPENPALYRHLVGQVRKQKEEIERKLSERSSTFRIRQELALVGLTEVVENLPPGSALVSFALFFPLENIPENQKTGPSYLAFVLGGARKEPIAVPLGPQLKIDVQVAAWIHEASGDLWEPEVSSRKEEKSYLKSAKTLRKSIWDPLVPYLKDVENVFLVPEGALHVVNFATLPARGGKYLLEDGPDFHYLAAERDLVREWESEPSGHGMLALGAPAFDDPSVFEDPVPDSENLEDDRSSQGWPSTTPFWGERSSCPAFQAMHFEALPGMEKEIRDIAFLWEEKSGEPSLTLMGREANEANFKEFSSRHRILHIATRGFFLGNYCASTVNPHPLDLLEFISAEDGYLPPITGENPLLLSGLAFAGVNHRQAAGAGEEDGVLTAEEIATLDLRNVDWAVLSANDTGLGTVQVGEGLFGLRRAFQVAGVDTVITSLWSTNAEWTRKWMVELYRGRLGGLTASESVRKASLLILQKRRESGEATHPYYWGAFIASGDWR